MTLSRDAVEALRAPFSGEILESSDPGYDAARTVHNGMIDKRPTLIASCLNSADIADAVRFARSEGLEISVRGGGHSPAGRAVTSDGLMINLAQMRATYVDPVRRRARVQGGANWNDYNRATAQHGLATTGGIVSTTGVAGLTLGGGIGWLMGRFGIASDNLKSVELITAEGEVLQVDEDSDPDLFWGLRGGGGNFGVAASFEFEAHPIDTILGGIVAYPFSDALRVLAPYQEVTADPPDELVTHMALTHGPDGSGAKIIAVPLCYSGEISAGEALVAPLRNAGTPAADLISPMPYWVMNTVLDAAYPKGVRNYWRSAFLKELDEDLVGTLVDAFERVPSPMTTILMESFHGAISRVDPTASAFPHREPGFNLVITGEWLDAADDDANIGWIRETFDAIEPYTGGAVYMNYLGDDESQRVRAAYGPNWERLVALKRQWDPENVFHLNQNIDPAG